jgi:uncharacterized membrane protein
MILWFYVAIIAYALNAIVFVVDKYLLSVPILKPVSYAFWVALLSAAVIVVIPFGVSWVSFNYFLIAFASGTAFFFSLIFLYKAVKKTDVSIASTKVGVMGVIFTYVWSVLILKDYFSNQDVIALGLLAVGILLMGKTGKGVWWEALMAGVAFGASTVLLKLTFNNSTFLNGFFWTRIGLVGAALFILVNPSTRKEVFLSFKNSPHPSRFIFLGNKILAGMGFALLYVAIKLGNVSIVNALLSVQFVFIFILALIFRNKIPGIAENIKGIIILEKLTGIALVGAGFLMLFKQ